MQNSYSDLVHWASRWKKLFDTSIATLVFSLLAGVDTADQEFQNTDYLHVQRQEPPESQITRQPLFRSAFSATESRADQGSFVEICHSLRFESRPWQWTRVQEILVAMTRQMGDSLNCVVTQVWFFCMCCGFWAKKVKVLRKMLFAVGNDVIGVQRRYQGPSPGTERNHPRSEPGHPTGGFFSSKQRSVFWRLLVCQTWQRNLRELNCALGLCACWSQPCWSGTLRQCRCDQLQRTKHVYIQSRKTEWTAVCFVLFCRWSITWVCGARTIKIWATIKWSEKRMQQRKTWNWWVLHSMQIFSLRWTLRQFHLHDLTTYQVIENPAWPIDRLNGSQGKNILLQICGWNAQACVCSMENKFTPGRNKWTATWPSSRDNYVNVCLFCRVRLTCVARCLQEERKPRAWQ